jgi:hypothetical protein
MPTWAGVDVNPFTAGFGIAEIGGATVFTLLLAFTTLRRLLGAAGL